LKKGEQKEKRRKNEKDLGKILMLSEGRGIKEKVQRSINNVEKQLRGKESNNSFWTKIY
jgi:hypothetical protein